MKVGIGVFATAPSGLAVATVDTPLGLPAAGVDIKLSLTALPRLPESPSSFPQTFSASPPLPIFAPGAPSDLAFLPKRLAWVAPVGPRCRDQPRGPGAWLQPGTAALLPRGLQVAVQASFNPPRLLPRMHTMLEFARRAPHVYLGTV